MKAAFFFIIVIVCLTPHVSGASEKKTLFLTSGTVRARALAMGGAYHSVEDDFSAGFSNPGAFKMYAARSERRFRVLLNPAATAVGLYDYSRYDYDFDRDDRLTVGESLHALMFLVKGVTFTTPVFDVGVGLGEEVIGGAPGAGAGRMLSFEGLSQRSFNSVFANFKIAPAVSLGFSGTAYSGRENGETKVRNGYAFGVLLTPNPRLNVGIVYNELPKAFADARLGLESIENQTATGGISYRPNDNTVLSIDLRTVNKEDLPTSREIHAGLERRFFERLALRAGYYRQKEMKSDVMSFGIGILPRWERLSKYASTTRNDIMSYTMVVEEMSFTRRWHVLSLLIRL